MRAEFRTVDSVRLCLLHIPRLGVMSITIIVAVLVLLVVGVAALGLRREQATNPTGAQSLAVLLIVVVAVLIIVYMVMQRSR